MGSALGSKPASTEVAPARSVESLLESKLRRPPARQEWIDRGRLLDQLDDALLRPITLIAAPTGFGKTTLLVQWLTSRQPSSPGIAWVSLDAGDNDPVRLWTHIATALERVGCSFEQHAAGLVAATSDEITMALLPRLIKAMAAMPDDFVIVLDDFHFLHEAACRDQVEFLVRYLPPQAHLVLTSRTDPGFRLGRLRASRDLGEIRAADLAFGPDEATLLLALERVQLSRESVGHLVQRAEGWPAGLYLATLSLSGRADPDELVRRFSGDKRFIGDYITEEVLSRQPDDIRSFITTVSIMDRFTSPLCDFVTGMTSSAAMLRELERSNLFLVAIDEDHRWYRFHHLFATAARAELELTNPERLSALHARAGAWFQDHGHVEEAIKHLLAAGNTSNAAVLVQANWMKYVSAGRAATVDSWLEAIGPQSVAANPAAGVTAAWMAAMSGDVAGLARHVEALDDFQDYGPLPDRVNSVESAIAMIKGLFGFGGPVEMTSAARRAAQLETDERSPYHSVALCALGHAAYVAGDLDEANRLLPRATHHEAALALIRVLSSSVHSLAESEAGNHEHAQDQAEFAMGIVEAGGLHIVPQASLAFTALAQVRATAGDIDSAMGLVEHGLAVRRRNPALSPWPTMHHLLVAARVASRADHLVQAEDLLAEAEQLMARYPAGMEAMRARMAAIRHNVRVPPTSLADEPLTDREIEVLRMLRGALSLNEIAARLYVSRNTVKSHTRALYRKLGVASRSEAVRVARDRGLA